MKQIEIALFTGALCGLILWFYYNKIKNTHIRDDLLPERGCCLFSFAMFVVADLIQIWRDFSWWNVAGLIICIPVIRMEIFSKIPNAQRIEEVKKKGGIIYTLCGRKRLPPHYNVE